MDEFLKSAYRRAYGLLGHRGLGRVPFLSQINGFFVQMLGKKPGYVEAEGGRMYLLEKDSAISNALQVLKQVEPATTEFFKKNVKEGDVVVDVGANIGYYTLIFSRKVGAAGKVFAFEPDPRNIAVLKKNVEANGCQNVTIVEKTVSDKEGKIRFYLGSTSDCSSMHPRDGNGKGVEVESTTLDKCFEGKVNLIKMDTEGAEASVFRGMKKLIGNNPGIIIVAELAPKLMENCGGDPRKYLDCIEELGFDIYDINENKRKVEKTSIDGLLGRYVKIDEATNLIFARKNTELKGL